jgi:NADPH-dependent 2,4-dienoyl-CoA reductase/sulfur reductase-like enzyme
MTVAVVGAGLAGLRCCEALRTRGYDGRVVLVGAETHPPYSRPPLSKEVLRGDKDPDSAVLRSDGELDRLGIEVALGRAAVRLRPGERELTLDDATVLRYDDVVIATGARPRGLAASAGRTVHTLRTVDDCLSLRSALAPGARVVVVGAGFIGLEVAAAARHHGCDVTVVDVLPAPLARIADPAIGAVLRRLHEERGVSFRLGAGVAEVRDDGIVLADGGVAPADVVVAGIGVVPETDWLHGSGLTVDNGVRCDETLSAAPGVWAVGDVARWRSRSLGAQVRVEHWTNATEQAEHVARAVCGQVEAFDPVPYFWSDQYDAKLQCLGHVASGDELAMVRGALDEPRWVALVRSGDRLGGVVGMRSPGQVMRLKPLLAAGSSWHDALDATASPS